VVDLPPLIGDTTLRGTVTDVKEATSIPAAGYYDTEAKPQGKFVLVFITVENTGLESGNIYITPVRLKDSKGRAFDMLSPASAAAGQAADVYKRQTAFSTIQPSFKADEVFVYDVAPDATGYVLVTK
jgi:hypothetical protein